MVLDQYESVTFKVRHSDYVEFERVANALFTAKRLKKPSVGLLAKMFLYVMTNQFKKLEDQALIAIQQERAQGVPPIV